MERQLRGLFVKTAGKWREAEFEGRAHVVVPVVALVEGVVHAMNSKFPEFVAFDEFEHSVPGWNGRPLYLGHPMKNGQPVSGNTPDVLEKKSIGRVFNAGIKGKKLTMEAWIDVEKSDAIDSRLLERVKLDEPIEISVGVFVDTDDSEGEYKGTKFVGAWHDLIPDHLALLDEGDVGACSREMGCGVRAAQKGPAMYEKWLEDGSEELIRTLRNIPQSVRDKMPKEDFAGPNESFPIEQPIDVADAAKAIGRAKGNRDAIKAKIIAIAYRKGASFVAKLPEAWKKKKDQKNASFFDRLLAAFRAAQPADEMSDGDLRKKLYEELKEVEPSCNYVEAFLPVTSPNRVVYSCYEMPSCGCGPSSYVLYQRAFTLGDNGEVTLGQDRIEVEPVLSYEPALMSEEPDEPTVAKGARNSKADQQKIQAMHDHAVALGAYCDPKMTAAAEDKTMEKKERVTALIGKGKTFTEADRTMLEGATEEQLTRFEAAAAATPEVKVETPAPTAAAATPEVKVETPKPATFAEVLKTASREEQDMINEGLRVGRERKAATIKTLKDSGRCDLTDEQLNGKSQSELDQLVKLAGLNTPRATGGMDFSGQGVPRTEGNKPAEVPAPPKLADAIKAARAAK